MVPYRNDLGFDQLPSAGPTVERNLLRIYTGDSLSDAEAKRLWARVADHKWFVSEQLSRDVGFHVAAIDYVENFYSIESSRRSDDPATAGHKIFRQLTRALEKYFEAKGRAILF